jgi:hypothetical protein
MIAECGMRNRELRKFGWTVGGVLLALAGLLRWSAPTRHVLAGEILAAAGTVLVALGMAYPAALREIRAGWLMLAYALGWVNTRLLLALFYYGIVSPVGLVMRLFGRDPLERKWSSDQPSYWIRREEQRPPNHFEHPF